MKTFALIGAAGYIAPRHLRAIKDKYKDSDFPVHATKAIEILNKMLGFNATEKTEVTYKEQPLFGEGDEPSVEELPEHIDPEQEHLPTVVEDINRLLID